MKRFVLAAAILLAAPVAAVCAPVPAGLSGVWSIKDYSPALKKAKFVWTAAKLDKWLQGPSRLVPGTKMFFTVSNKDDRAAIIAYLAAQK